MFRAMLAEPSQDPVDMVERRETAEADETVLSDGLEPVLRGHRIFNGKRGGHALSAMQSAFARYYVINGGDGAQAARDAGYGSPTMAVKNLTNPSILAEIKRLSIVNAEAMLPKLLRDAFAALEDSRLHPNDRLNHTFKLLDRLGMRPKTDPLVTIHNDNRNQVVTADAAQQLIQQIWDTKQRRVSGISGTMSDVDRRAAETLASLDDEGVGGGETQGPSPAPDPIPLSTDENYDDC